MKKYKENSIKLETENVCGQATPSVMSRNVIHYKCVRIVLEPRSKKNISKHTTGGTNSSISFACCSFRFQQNTIHFCFSNCTIKCDFEFCFDLNRSAKRILCGSGFLVNLLTSARKQLSEAQICFCFYHVIFLKTLASFKECIPHKIKFVSCAKAFCSKWTTV